MPGKVHKREFYIPVGAKLVTREGVKAEVYIYTNKNGHPAACGFKGRAKKPTFRHYYGSVEVRDKWLNNWFADLETLSEEKAKRRAEANQPHTLKLGDILVSSWGYDQTNVDFYKVTKIVGKTMVEVREINRVHVGGSTLSHGIADEVIAGDRFIALATRRKVSMFMGSPSISLSSFQSASLWDGKPESRSWYA
ncbi:MAG: hypothetical protein JKY41_15500 [Rhodobacteraceae bacterium]|nr:hypothetical protein [Paracoccaceae bacterium]